MSNAVGNRISGGKCGSIFRQDHDKTCAQCKFDRMFMQILFDDPVLNSIDDETYSRLSVVRGGPEVR